MNNRRVFMLQCGLAAGVLGVQATASAQGAMVAETDPQAQALGYKPDATKVDKAKFPKYAAGQKCESCALYQGVAPAKSGGCAIFAGKQVSANGWCSAFAKKG